MRKICSPGILFSANRTRNFLYVSSLIVSGAIDPSVIFTVRKQSLRRLCFHRCLSVHGEGGVCSIACWDTPRTRGRHPPRPDPPGQTPQADTPRRVQCMLGYGQQAGGTHPTGMHSCFKKVQIIVLTVRVSLILFTTSGDSGIPCATWGNRTSRKASSSCWLPNRYLRVIGPKTTNAPATTRYFNSRSVFRLILNVHRVRWSRPDKYVDHAYYGVLLGSFAFCVKANILYVGRKTRVPTFSD